MPILNFGVLTVVSASTTNLTLVTLARTIGPATATCASGVGSLLVGLIRSPDQPIVCAGNFISTADLKRMLKLGAAQASCAMSTMVQFFLNAVATPPPVGALSLPSINSLLNPQYVPAGFGGSRFVRGTLIPIQFKVRGQKLAGLNVSFIAYRTDEPTTNQSPILKTAPGSINQTDLVEDTSTHVETLTGDFTLDPGDTLALPNTDIEFVYEFSISDGLGRVYALESGKFRVYSIY